MGELIAKLDTESFLDFINVEQPVLVDFWAAWCGPCKMMSPVVDDLARDMEGRLSVGKLNVDEESEVAYTWGITNIPTLILFKAGLEQMRLTGYHDQDELIELITAALK